MTVLSVVQDAWDRLGIDDTAPDKILRTLLTQEGKELSARGTWQRLVKEMAITTTATQVQTGALPADFSRMIPGTAWNYTENEPLLGPLDGPEWQSLSAGLVGPPDLWFRLRGNDFLLLPTPSAGLDIRYEYVSRYWVDTDSDGVGNAENFGSDADTFLLDEELLTLGVIWRWLKRHRLPYNDEFAEYQMHVQQALGRDGVRGPLEMGGRSYAQRRPQVPDGSWNL